MEKFETEDMLGAMFALNFALIEGLISQNVVERESIIRFFQATLDRQEAEPLLPAVSFAFSRLIKHLQRGQNVSQATLQ